MDTTPELKKMEQSETERQWLERFEKWKVYLNRETRGKLIDGVIFGGLIGFLSVVITLWYYIYGNYTESSFLVTVIIIFIIIIFIMIFIFGIFVAYSYHDFSMEREKFFKEYYDLIIRLNAQSPDEMIKKVLMVSKDIETSAIYATNMEGKPKFCSNCGQKMEGNRLLCSGCGCWMEWLYIRTETRPKNETCVSLES
jgi:hypothetical protein